MSIYTDSMVAELMASKEWSYDAAVEFAAKHPTLSVRSVISKIKSLQLAYTPKVKVAVAKTDKVKKSEIVADIANALAMEADAIAGLAKADGASLRALLAKVTAK